MDKLIVKNFGPIKDISIDVNDINIFIGPTSSGKSVVAKLIAIFTDPTFLGNSSYNIFLDFLNKYNIDFRIKDTTEITYKTPNYYWTILNNGFTTNNPYNKEFYEISTIDKYHSNKASIGNSDEMAMLAILNNLATIPDHLLIKDDENKNSKRKVDFKEYKYFVNKRFSKANESIKICNPIYVPAERILLSMVGESLFGLMNNGVSIAECLKDFGSKFESARKNIKSFDVTFLQVQYEYSEKSNYLKLSDGTKIKLEASSSGFQSLIPLMLVIEHSVSSQRIIDNYFVIEEPEMNLYPTMQQSLVEFIISKVNHTDDKLIITTHSPYTLTALDNLIQAKNAHEKHPELKEEINKVVPENLWVDFNKVACYYFEDGYCRSTLDMENQSVGPSNIDDVSEKLGETFDQLLALKYHD